MHLAPAYRILKGCLNPAAGAVAAAAQRLLCADAAAPGAAAVAASSTICSETPDVECAVIGAGVVGLAIARELALAGRSVLLLEAAGTCTCCWASLRPARARRLNLPPLTHTPSSFVLFPERRKGGYRNF